MSTDAAAVEGSTAETQFCYRHPDRETYIRCGRCDRPICTKCAMLGPVGMRCKQCGRPARDPLHHMTPLQLGAGAGVALGAGTIAGFIGLQVGFFAIFVGPIIGGFLAEAVLRVTGYKRGPRMWLLVGGGIVLGALIAATIQFLVLTGGVEAFAQGRLRSYLRYTGVGACGYNPPAMVGALARIR